MCSRDSGLVILHFITMNHNILVFTDLDGTLLDHENYSYAAAQPTLDFICENKIPLIFTTSKTAIEVEELCTQTNFYHPFISENGGLLAIPENYFSDQPTTRKYIKQVIGRPRNEINQILSNLTSSYQFRTFNDMSIKELIDHTGLESSQAHFANQRDSTEPLLWLDEISKLSDFTHQLEQHDLNLISGGRFYHVMGDHDKATTMVTLINMFQEHWDNKATSIALGDSPNDLKMLQTAQYGIIIPNPHAPKMCIDNRANLINANHPGPHGWNDSLYLMLKELIE